MKYYKDSTGKIIACGDLNNGTEFDGSEPFDISNFFDYKWDNTNQAWIYDPIPQPTENTIEL